MPSHAIRNGLLPNIIRMHRTINPPRINLIPRLRHRNSRDRKIRLDEIHRPLHPRIPYSHTPIITPGHQHLFTPWARRHAIYDLFVPLVTPDALAGFQVPGCEGGVGGGGEEMGGGAGPVEVEDCAFVAG